MAARSLSAHSMSSASVAHVEADDMRRAVIERVAERAVGRREVEIHVRAIPLVVAPGAEDGDAIDHSGERFKEFAPPVCTRPAFIDHVAAMENERRIVLCKVRGELLVCIHSGAGIAVHDKCKRVRTFREGLERHLIPNHSPPSSQDRCNSCPVAGRSTSPNKRSASASGEEGSFQGSWNVTVTGFGAVTILGSCAS